MSKEPPLTKEERKEFKIALIRRGLTIRKWAEQRDYNHVYVRQVLCGAKTPNYLSLLIRNYIREVNYDGEQSSISHNRI